VSGAHAFRRRLRLESLEDRTLPSAYLVTTTADIGAGSLRDAITQINADTNHTLYPSPTNPSVDEIDFTITALSDTGLGYNSATSVATIKPTGSGLPIISNPVFINGWSQPGFAVKPLIELDGSVADPGSNGLVISAGNSTVRGLVIDSFDSFGIVLDAHGNDTLEGNFVGTDPTGAVAKGNHDTGILIGWHVQSNGNTIGGTAAASRNVISGNRSVNLFINGCDGNVVEGNFIGTDASGTVSLSNTAGFRSGVWVLAGNNNIIGGTTSNARNLISGNSGGNGNGVEVNNFPGVGGNQLLGNYIGTDITGTSAVPNQIGINSSASLTTSPIQVSGNLISGNTNIGLSMVGPGHDGGIAQGNKIGTDAPGLLAIGNGTGVVLNAGATLGGPTDAARNTVSGNLGDNVFVINGGNVVQGNYIGTDKNGNAALGTKGSQGVNVVNSQGDQIIGNVIANGQTGIRISGPSTSGIVVKGNSIGIGVDGHTPVPNGIGVALSGGTTNNTIGAIADGEGNTIAFNTGTGIDVSGGTGNAIRGNSIFANVGPGIVMGNGANNNQAAPVLASANAGVVTRIAGTLNGNANTTYGLDFFASEVADPSGHGEGQYYLGTATVTTDQTGYARFTTDLSANAVPAGVVPAGWSISATATDSDGNSSEFCLNVSAGAGETLEFETSQPYAAGSFPFGVVVGDFNGDGISDLAVSNLASNDISILRGNRNGTFQAAVNISVGPSPVALTSADFNGDGISDLAVTSQGGVNAITILLGDSDGTIQVGTPCQVGLDPTSIAVGDFNGDGKADLAVANFSSSDISILLGNGDGTFQAAVNHGNGASPYDILVADLDGDHISDLAVANIDADTVSIMFGNGDGTFRAPVVISAGTRTGAVNAGDFNGDGKTDLVVTSLSSSEISILVGRGDGTFELPANYAVGYWSNSVAVADFNGDGKSDLAVPTYSSNVVSILVGNGDATFRTAAIVAVGLNPVEVAVGDFNGDGKPDLVTTNSSSNDVSVLRNITPFIVANVPPFANAVSLSTNEDTPYSSQVTGGDADNDPISFTQVTGPIHGRLDFNPNGSFTYTPDPNFNGRDSFTFVADDGKARSNPAAVSIAIAPVNDAPQASNTALVLSDSGLAVFLLQGNDMETPAANLVFTITSLPINGVLYNDVGQLVHVGDTFTGSRALRYQLTFAFGNVTDSFTYTVTDTGDPAGTPGNALTSATATISLTPPPASDGIVRVGGTDANDTIIVDKNGTNLRVRLNSQTLSNSIPLTSVTQVRVFGRLGDDSVQISGVVLAGLVDGGAGTDSLSLDGTSAADAITLTSGAVTINGTVVSQTAVENLTVNALGGADSLSLVSAAAGEAVLLDGGGGSDTAVGPNADTTWSVAGANQFVVGGVAFNAVENITGGSANDTFAFANGGSLSGTLDGGSGPSNDTADYSALTAPMTADLSMILNMDTIRGAAGQLNTLKGANIANTWVITSNNGGTLNGGLTFVTFGNVIGGNGVDTFALHAGGSLSGLLDGGSGNSDALKGADGFNFWQITGTAATNTGLVSGVVAFANIENLIGGAGQDWFAFVNPTAAIRGTIDGGAGLNSIDYDGFGHGYSTPVTVNLGAIPIPTATGTAGISNIGVVYGGSSAADTLTGANVDNTWVVYAANSENVNDFVFANFENLVGGTGTDTFWFQSGGSYTVSVDGGAGTDTLIGDDVTNAWTITGTAAAGTGALNGMAFKRIENLSGGAGNDSFAFGAGTAIKGTIDGKDGTDTLDYSAFTTAVSVNLAGATATSTGGFANIESAKGGGGSGTLTGWNVDEDWVVINSNSGWVETALNTNIGKVLIFDGFAQLVGGTGNDLFDISSVSPFGGSVDGGGGVHNVLGGPDESTSWSITGTSTTNTGSLFYDIFGAESFANIQNLVGGSGDDNFAFAAGKSIAGFVNGGDGTDTLNYSAYTTKVTVNLGTLAATGVGSYVVNVEGVQGGTNAGDTLIAADGGNTLSITGSNAGTVNGVIFSGLVNFTFGGVENLTGGAGDDWFKFQGGSVSGSIDGGDHGGALNRLDYSASAGPVTVNLQTGKASLIGGTFNINNIVDFWGSGSANDTLIGFNMQNAWQVNGPNYGTIDGLGFLGFENLTGGTGQDRFVFQPTASITGALSGGGGGTDVLDLSAFTTAVTVNLSAGTATAVGGAVSNIRTVVGGSAADTITGDGKNNILLGGAGNDTLVGGSGHDLLIGGSGADSLSGGGGDDILVGGTTSYFNEATRTVNLTALDAILAEWASANSYAVRVNNIRTGGGLTAGLVLNGSSVLDDGAADTLGGGAGSDWFFAHTSGTGKDSLTDAIAGETVTPI
jgi:hypothetical protein